MARNASALPDKKPAARVSRGEKRRFPFFQIVFWLVLCMVFLPIVEVLAVRYWNPIYTPLMLIRRIEGRSHPGPAPKPTYRWVDLENVSPHFLKAVWQTEDARFFQHNGFDWKEIDHAMADAKRSGKPVRGASTITMQCARSLFLWQGRSWIRKPLEAYYTILMETILTKRRIFELYVNVIETGDGFYGVEAAAEYYWRIPAKKILPREAALLTAALPNPRERNLRRPSAKVLQRAAMVTNKLRRSPRWPL